MTKPNFTSINVIMDASGSMQPLQSDTIGSFNQFLQEQKELPDQAVFSLTVFNTKPTVVHDFVELASVPNLNPKIYAPSGGTALLDAMGTAIDKLGQRLAAMPEEERPSKQIILVITDGQENASSEYSLEQIKTMVKHQQEVYSWVFVFMGANIDAFSTGTGLGVAGNNTMNYTPTAAGTRNLYNTISDSMRSYRSSEVSPTVGFFDQQPTIKK